MTTLNITKPLLHHSVKTYRDTGPLWTYSLNWKTKHGLKIYFRTLLNACVKIPSTSNHQTNISLRDIIQTQKNTTLGTHRKVSAPKAVMEFMLSQLSQEGLITSDSCFLLYPNHTPYQVNEVLEETLPALSYRFGSYCIKDSLIRWKQTLNKSIARTNKEHYKINFETEFNSLCLDIKRKMRDKTVIVLDDFTTTGLSLDSSRNLLEKVDVDKVVLCAIGKYTRPTATFSSYEIQKDFNPFIEADKVSSKDIIQEKKNLFVDTKAQDLIIEYFQRINKQ
jgi:hypoxanthine phosphoribosyltransferase